MISQVLFASLFITSIKALFLSLVIISTSVFQKPSLATMYLTQVSRSVHPPAPYSHSTDILAHFLSVMALAIMGTNAAVAAEPKIGLEERACFCK